jgi:sulfur carrier protein ThiS
MEVIIEAYSESYVVKVNGKIVWRGSYLDGALETARKEILARYPNG